MVLEFGKNLRILVMPFVRFLVVVLLWVTGDYDQGLVPQGSLLGHAPSPFCLSFFFR